MTTKLVAVRLIGDTPPTTATVPTFPSGHAEVPLFEWQVMCPEQDITIRFHTLPDRQDATAVVTCPNHGEFEVLIPPTVEEKS